MIHRPSTKMSSKNTSSSPYPSFQTTHQGSQEWENKYRERYRNMVSETIEVTRLTEEGSFDTDSSPRNMRASMRSVLENYAVGDEKLQSCHVEERPKTMSIFEERWHSCVSSINRDSLENGLYEFERQYPRPISAVARPLRTAEPPDKTQLCNMPLG